MYRKAERLIDFPALLEPFGSSGAESLIRRTLARARQCTIAALRWYEERTRLIYDTKTLLNSVDDKRLKLSRLMKHSMSLE